MGFDAHLFEIFHTTRTYLPSLQLIWLSETKLRDFTNIHALRRRVNDTRGRRIVPPFRFYGGKNFSNSNARRSAHGGGAWIALDPSLIIEKLNDSSLGMVSIAVRRKGCKAIAMIGLYNPPRDSVFQELHRGKEGVSHTDALLSLAAAEYKQLTNNANKSRFSAVYICGDQPSSWSNP